jgi:hypothetical protein
MTKLADKLWNWGHLEGSHNDCTNLNCKMTPEEFAAEYGIKNAFIVSYGGNICPPFHNLANRLSSLKEIKWSVLGDASTPLPDAELGNTEDILDVLDSASNITGGVVDDFFSPKRMERFTPEVLKKIKARLNQKGLDFWCVLYELQIDFDLEKYMDCFDGITFWIWKSAEIQNMEAHLQKLFALTKDKPTMLGVYLWDYNGRREMDPKLFETQLSRYFDLLKDGKTDGVIVCSSTIGDADLETNRILKRYVQEQGDIEIP